MRIVSKFRDYYDGAARDFSKDSLCFVRKTEIVQKTQAYDYSQPKTVEGLGKHIWTPSYGDDCDFGVIGFCGKIYPYIKFGRYLNPVFLYKAGGCKSSVYVRGYNGDVDWFKRFQDPPNPLSRVFFDHKAAYFNLTRDGLTIYPILRQLAFFKVFGVPDAYQTIEMYLGNVLHRRDNPYIAPVPDKIKAESHGFDKWRFRKEPSSWRHA